MNLAPPYSNQQIARLLKNIATAYIIKKKNPFRVTAYQQAADSIVNYPKPLQTIWQQDPKLLDDIPGIGPKILEKIDYLFTHHRLHPHIARLFNTIHPAIFELTQIEGIGPKTAHILTQKLKFPLNPKLAVSKLIAYAQNDQIKKIPRFGSQSQQNILKNAQSYLGLSSRLPLAQAQAIAKQIIDYLKIKFPHTEFIPLGSLRRLTPTIGDIDIAAKSATSTAILNHFVNFPLTQKTINHGPKKASIKIKNDVHVDLMVQPPVSFGSLLQHFTGSKQHNILLRLYAQKLGYSLSEYGIKNLHTKKLHTFTDEKDFYRFLGLKYIPPPDRVGESEIKNAILNYNN